MSSAAVMFHEVSFAYPGRGPVLVDISMQVLAGEIAFICSSSGVGKSTLLGVASGLLRESSGKCTAAGRVGVVFQSNGLFPWMNIADNVAIGQLNNRKLSTESSDLVSKALETVGLEKKSKELPDRVSGGEQRLAQIARLLVSEAAVWLLDEPLVGLDPPSRKKVRDLITQEARSRGASLLWATHTIEDIEVADRLWFLRQNGGKPPATLIEVPLVDEGGKRLTIKQVEAKLEQLYGRR